MELQKNSPYVLAKCSKYDIETKRQTRSDAIQATLAVCGKLKVYTILEAKA